MVVEILVNTTFQRVYSRCWCKDDWD